MIEFHSFSNSALYGVNFQVHSTETGNYYALNVWLVGPQSRSERFLEEINILPLLEIEPKSLRLPICSPVTIHNSVNLHLYIYIFYTDICPDNSTRKLFLPITLSVHCTRFNPTLSNLHIHPT